MLYYLVCCLYNITTLCHLWHKGLKCLYLIYLINLKKMYRVNSQIFIASHSQRSYRFKNEDEACYAWPAHYVGLGVTLTKTCAIVRLIVFQNVFFLPYSPHNCHP